MIDGINPINTRQIYHAITLKEIMKIKPKEIENLPDLNELYPDENLGTNAQTQEDAKIQRVKALLQLEQKRLEKIYMRADIIAKKYRNEDDPVVLKMLENDWAGLVEVCKNVQTRILALGNAIGISSEKIENAEGAHGGFGTNEGKTIRIEDLDNIPDIKELYPEEGFSKFHNLSKSEKMELKERANLLLNAEAKALNGIYYRAGNVANAYKNAKSDEDRLAIKEKWDIINEKCALSQAKVVALKGFLEKIEG